MEKQDIDNRQTKKFKIDFSNAIVVLVGVAILSVIIYAFILRISSPAADPNTPNQLNNQFIDEDEQEILASGNGYIAYRKNGQIYLEITDASKISSVEGLLLSLDLPSTTEIINPGAAHARPIPAEELEEPSDHEDTDFDPINPNQPEQPTPVPNE